MPLVLRDMYFSKDDPGPGDDFDLPTSEPLIMETAVAGRPSPNFPLRTRWNCHDRPERAISDRILSMDTA